MHVQHTYRRARAIPRAAFLDAAKRATLSEAEQAALIYRGHEQAMLQLYERLSSAVRVGPCIVLQCGTCIVLQCIVS